jgi:hypothetical protein
LIFSRFIRAEYLLPSDPFISPLVKAVRVVVGDSKRFPRYKQEGHTRPADIPPDGDIEKELAQVLFNLPNADSLYLDWEYSPQVQIGRVIRRAWPILAPRLRKIGIKTHFSPLGELASLGPCAANLQELELVVEVRDSDPTSYSSPLEGCVPALILPSQTSLIKLKFVLNFSNLWKLDVQRHLPAGSFFTALTNVHFPRLRSLIVRSPFGRSMSQDEEQPLIRFVGAHDLHHLSVVPSPLSTDYSDPIRISQEFGMGYERFLYLLQKAGSEVTPQLRSLLLFVVPATEDTDVLPRTINLISSLQWPLADFSLDGRHVGAEELRRVLFALSTRASAIHRLCLNVDVLKPSVLKIISESFPELQTLELSTGMMSGDWAGSGVAAFEEDVSQSTFPFSALTRLFIRTKSFICADNRTFVCTTLRQTISSLFEVEIGVARSTAWDSPDP